MGEEDVAHKYIIGYYSAIKKNENFPFVTKWMDLASIMLSEVSQRKINTVPFHFYVESEN